MTTYTTIPDADIDQDSPVTQPLMTALRDNPIAIAEGDSSVPEALRSTSLLATLTPTSGTSISTPTLTLTGYRKLFISYDDLYLGVGAGGTYAATSMAGLHIAGIGEYTFGLITICLLSGIANSAFGSTVTAPPTAVQDNTPSHSVYRTTIGTATTSLTFTVTSGTGGTYTSGTIRVFAEH